ncbi:hypothetical protein SO802_029123 [Lithocarpus litseifolius]|uniref:Uncharacterized protein n=1 Tax=Lithocarpus litseifolius TaxID=425828 RepID=A0AAW2BSG8_9ROSI
METDYARLSFKSQSLLRSAIANLPTKIQFCILENKAMFISFDLWFEYFKILVTTAFPDPANSDDLSDIYKQADWEEYLGSSLKVYEKKHLFPGLLFNYEDGLDDADGDPNWLSQMFEYAFIRLIKLTSHDQISQFPQIIQMAVTQINSHFTLRHCYPLNDLRKDPNALYALLKLTWAEEEVAANRDLEDEGSKASSEASIAKNPYQPYNQDLFGHDEEDTPDLGFA